MKKTTTEEQKAFNNFIKSLPDDHIIRIKSESDAGKGFMYVLFGSFILLNYQIKNLKIKKYKEDIIECFRDSFKFKSRNHVIKSLNLFKKLKWI